MNKALFGLTLAMLWYMPTAAADTTSPPDLAIGIDLEVAPSGSISTQIGSARSTSDAATSYGIGGLLAVGVSRYFSVGFAPRYLLNIKTADSQNDPGGGNDGGGNDTATELDLRIRVAAHVPLALKLQAYGFASPGYSVIFAPRNSNNNGDNPSGISIGLGAGLQYALSESLAFTGELGYQVGYQSVTVDVFGVSADVDFETRYLHLGAGLMLAL